MTAMMPPLRLAAEGSKEKSKTASSLRALRFYRVRILERKHLFERRNIAEDSLIVRSRLQGSAQHLLGRGIAVYNFSVPVEGRHAVRHVKKERVKLVAFVFRFLERLLQDPRHVVERIGQNADFILGRHFDPVGKIPRRHPLCASVSRSIGVIMVFAKMKLSSTEMASPKTSASTMIKNSSEFKSCTVSPVSRI
jgi:hypothetical protein